VSRDGIETFGARHVHNKLVGSERRAVDARIFSVETTAAAMAEISTWPGYVPTPLVKLQGLASALGLAKIFYKDESRRFDLMSFKALGGAYAVLGVVRSHLKSRGIETVSTRKLLDGAHRDLAREITVATATDGNHGRSVAWGAQMFGARCKIYLHAHVSKDREAEIAKYGAEILRIDGGYDDSVRQCAADAARNGWILVADTNSGGGDPAMPALIMQGYTVMVEELTVQLSGPHATQIFVQGGVGGIAAAVAAHLTNRYGAQRPRIIVVEPMQADCIFRSIAAGRPTAIAGDVETFMACLAAGEISPLAWPYLKSGVDDVITLPEAAAPPTMRLLANGAGGDPPLVSGESGCVAIAGLIEAASDPELRSAIGLTDQSVVIAIGSEGATDASTYRLVVGRAADEVSADAAARTKTATKSPPGSSR
jgi:diaminopropionate ammonia-lyase